jgi:hypothetical protein
MTVETRNILGLITGNVGGAVVSEVTGGSVPAHFFLHDLLTLMQIAVALVTVVYVAIKIGQSHEKAKKSHIVEQCPLNKLPPEVLLEKLEEASNGKNAIIRECPLNKLTDGELARIIRYSKMEELP